MLVELVACTQQLVVCVAVTTIGVGVAGVLVLPRAARATRRPPSMSLGPPSQGSPQRRPLGIWRRQLP